jgi:LemA protein
VYVRCVLWLGIVVAAAAVAGVAFAGWVWNGLVRARQGVHEAWAQIEVLLDRRSRLVGDLVNIAAAAAEAERTTVERVTEARAFARAPATPTPRGEAEAALTEVAHTLIARAEAYPTLTADATFRNLQRELVSTEDEVAASRRYYNGRVRLYHDALAKFPHVVVAGPLGFRRTEYFQAAADDREAPRVA